MSDQDHQSIQRQISNTEKNLRLVEEEISIYVMEIPLQLKKRERELKAKLEELRKRLEALPDAETPDKTPDKTHSKTHSKRTEFKIGKWTIFSMTSVVSITSVLKLFLLPLIVGVTVVVSGKVLIDMLWNEEDLPDTYNVKVTVLDPQNQVTQDIELSISSLDVIPKSVGDGFQLDIPASTLPEDRKIQVRAYKSDDFLAGQDSLTLGRDAKPTLTLHLKRDNSAFTFGFVIDRSTDEAIQGVRVVLTTPEGEMVATSTNSDGYFRLPAHRSPGESVVLQLSRPSYRREDYVADAGIPERIFMEREQ